MATRSMARMPMPLMMMYADPSAHRPTPTSISGPSGSAVRPSTPACSHRSIIDPQKKKVTNGHSEGTRRSSPAHTASISAAKAPWASPTVSGVTSRSPSANTSRGSVPSPASMKQVAPTANRTHPARYSPYCEAPYRRGSSVEAMPRRGSAGRRQGP